MINKVITKKIIRTAICFIGIGAGVMQLRAEDGESLLVAARANEAKLESWTTVQKLASTSKGTPILRTDCFLRQADGSVLVRREIGRPGKASKANVTITNRDGTWELHNGVAIRKPDLIVAPSEEVVEGITRQQASLQAEKPEYVVESVDLGGGQSCWSITVTLLPATVEKLHALVLERLKLPAVREAELKNGRPFLPDDFTPVTYKYLIDKKQNFITCYTTLAKSGRIIERKEYISVNTQSRHPETLFSVPADAKLLFPSTKAEYEALHAQYRSTSRKTTK